MRLLLVLSALIAGLTGLIAGQPAAARDSQPTSIAAAFVGATEQAGDAVQVRHAPVAIFRLADSRSAGPGFAPIFLPQSHPVDERRRE